jgi:hypothetical protein
MKKFDGKLVKSLPTTGEKRGEALSVKIRKKSKETIVSNTIPSNLITTPLALKACTAVALFFPLLPSLDFHNMAKEEVLRLIQEYISSFKYNYTSTMFFKLKKTGGTSHVLETFNLLTKYALPIQCVEAVFIGSILTAGWSNAVRIPICFKSKFQSNIYRHIVLAVHQDGKWGCLGISRRSNLMFKDFIFNSLWELIEDFIHSYESNFHKLLTVYSGLPLPNNFYQEQSIHWKVIKFKIFDRSLWNQERERLDQFLAPFPVHRVIPSMTKDEEEEAK